MSARTSFYSFLGDAQAGRDPANIVPDLSNPLHSSTPRRGNGAQANSSHEHKAASGLGGLRRPRDNRTGSHAGQVAQQEAGTAPGIFRPPTADPHRRTQGQTLQRPDTARPLAAGKHQHAGTRREASFPPGIMAPAPVKASLPSRHLDPSLDSPENPFSLSTFKVPALPQSRENQASVQASAHTSTGNEPPRAASRQATRTPDSSMGSASTLIDSSMETTHSFKSQHDGPRRVILQKTGQHFEADSFPVDFVSTGHIVNNTGRVVQLAGQKRSREQDDDDYSILSQEPAKRARMSTGKEEHRQQFERSGGDDPYQSVRNDRGFVQIPDSSHPSQISTSHRREPSALNALLAADTDALAKDYMMEYDERTRKWSECEIDEWVAGAEEILARLTNILDTVKDHLLSKVKLYTKFHQKLDVHTRDLDGRQRALTAAKEMYVKDSQNAIIQD